MILLIDAYNVLKTMHSAHFIAPPLAQRFISIVFARAQLRGYRAEIIFDGGPGGQYTTQQYPYGTIIYTGSAKSADDSIRERAELLKGDEVVVISADRAVRSAASRFGAKLVDPEVFWRIIHTPNTQVPRAVPTAPTVTTTHHAAHDTRDIAVLLKEASVDDHDKEYGDEQNRIRTGYTESKQEKKMKRLVERL